MIDFSEIARLHYECVIRWHERPIDNPYEGFLALVCTQASFNFLLWHEEDKARCPLASDSEIAQVKRTIDGLNQKRNDWIERLDDAIAQMLVERGVEAKLSAPANTETLGSVIDRLSILALRIFHLGEQLERPDASADHRDSVGARLHLAAAQLESLLVSGQQLADDIFAGRKRHCPSRQLKMYNDAELNPLMFAPRARPRALPVS